MWYIGDIPPSVEVPSANVGMKTATAVGSLAKTVTKTTMKSGAASAVKKVPIVGAFFGLGLASMRLFSGDPIGALLVGASGLASVIPGVGTASSAAIDLTIAARDVRRNYNE